jgi:CheY-like chemotaxis protein
MVDLNEDNVSLCFEIEDNGPGIPKKMHKKIFDNFTQLDENNNINYQGTGLGLSIVKKLVELFGSKIELESEIGQGSIFRFNVDFKIDKHKKIVVKKFKENALSLTAGLRILVAEDNKINQIVTQNLLKKAGYECDIVQNGVEAIAALKKNEYNLILMDINMPIMNGNEATIAIRKLNSKIPIIALTAADIEEVKRDYLDIGYNDIVTKPFDNYEFFQTIATYIEQGKLEANYNVKLEKVS